MVLNIEFQLSALVFEVMIILMFFSKKSLRFLSEKLYTLLLFSVLGSTLLDIFSIFAINFKEKLPVWFGTFVCKAYLLSIMLSLTMLYLYISTDIKKVQKKIEDNLIWYFTPTYVLLVLGFILPIRYYVDYERHQIYFRGIFVSLVFLFVGGYLIFILCDIAKNREYIDEKRRKYLFSIVYMWIGVAVFQALFRQFLIVSLIMSLNMVYIYLVLENPDKNIDKKTGVFNYDAFLSYIKRLYDEEESFSIITIVYDNRSFITETFGMRNIENVLKEMAVYFNEIDEGNVFYTNDAEFSLIVRDNVNAAKDLADKISKRFEENWQIASIEMNFPVNICEIYDPSIAKSSRELSEIMRYFVNYIRQKTDMNRIVVNSDILREKQKKDIAERTLMYAIEDELIDVVYQPIYSIEKNAFTSLEAFMRIKDETGKYLSASVFIPIAEQNGMILKLSTVVFTKVMRFIKEYTPMKYGIDHISINLSNIQCMKENLADELSVIMKKHNVDPSCINLELSETAAVNFESVLLKNMRKLLRTGTTFSLDKFGTGYSNLSCVVGFPFRFVKLDKQLVWSYFESDRSVVATEFSLSMIKHLGIKIVAVGIETQVQADKLKQLGVDYLQGYYFSKPLDKDNIIKLLLKVGYNENN